MSNSYNFQRVRNDRQNLSQVNAEVVNAETLNATVVAGSANINGNATVNGRFLAQPFYMGMSVADVATGATLTYDANVISVNDYTGAAAQVVTLPAATSGTKVIHFQSIDTTGGVNTLSFDCAGDDVIRTGSILLATIAGGGSTFATSTAGNTQIVFTPANATTNFVSRGSQFVFLCVEDGIWDVILDNSQCQNNTLTAVTGDIAFLA